MYDNAGWTPFMGGQPQPVMPDASQQNMMPGMPGWPGWPANKYQQSSRQLFNDFWVPVNTLEEAKNVFVQPGQRKWIMILNAMMFAVKTVNSAGATDFQAFDFQPHVEVQVPPPDQQMPQDIANLGEQLQRVLKELSDMKQEVASLKEVRNNGRKPFGANANGNGPAGAAKPAAGHQPNAAAATG